MEAAYLIQQAKEKLANKNNVPFLKPTNCGANYLLQYQLLNSKSINNSLLIKKYKGVLLLKYFICLLFATALSIVSAWNLVSGFILFIIIFYLVETCLVFSAYLTLDGNNKPFIKSIQLVFKENYFSVLLITISCASFMLIGLFHLKNPLRNWYIACTAVLIWYHEIKNR